MAERLQDFRVYGGDLFMDQNVHTLRDFFRGVFSSREEARRLCGHSILPFAQSCEVSTSAAFV